MDKFELKSKTDSAISEIRDVLQTVYDALNQGQQKKILKDEKVASIFERYKVNI